MNIRLSKNSVRLRLNKNELDRLLAHGELSETTIFPSGGEIHFGARVQSGQADLSVLVQDGSVLFEVSSQALNDFASAPITKDSALRAEILDGASGRKFEAALEIDIFGR